MKKRNNKLEKKRIENSKLPISEHAVLEISFDDDLGFFFDFFFGNQSETNRQTKASENGNAVLNKTSNPILVVGFACNLICNAATTWRCLVF